MSDSLRRRIEALIEKASDEAQRVMLMLLLSVFDTSEETREKVGEVATSVQRLSGQFAEHDAIDKAWRDDNFRDLDAETHRDDHAIVNGIRIERRKNSELVQEAKKGFAGEMGRMVAVALCSAAVCVGSILAALKVLGG